MGLRIIIGREAGDDDGREVAILFCSTSGRALAPIFTEHLVDPTEPVALDAHDVADRFTNWCNAAYVKPRTLSPSALCELVEVWHAEGCPDDYDDDGGPLSKWSGY